ncbi:sulfite exporter TauE/SafE family protein [Acidovorax lacteus]|uniref:Urease accessory protein UreH-like transmembrane domain-containing protein n=1 Tax=Acidovorax lacteus TaxID=1924988 RepID=A0ABP8LIB1_9BURK
MSTALIMSAWVMGVLGGAHCLVMCSAPCSTVVQATPPQAASGLQTVQWASLAPPSPRWSRLVGFHLGRLLGYGLLGAGAALAMDSLAWFSQATAALRPLWSLAHVAMLAWGLLLVLQARQPQWVEAGGRAVWRRLGPWVGSSGGAVGSGVAWALMPCGLLYSALLVAALSGGALAGAGVMVAFGLGTGLWLVSAPWAWGRLRRVFNAWRAEWGTRLAGGMLCAVAVWALWYDLVHKPSLWCR